MRRVKIVIPILKNYLANHDRFKRHNLFLELKTVEKYDILERGFTKRLKTKLAIGLLGRKDRRTKIGNFI